MASPNLGWQTSNQMVNDHQSNDTFVQPPNSRVKITMDPDILPNKQIFAQKPSIWSPEAPKKIQPHSTLGNSLHMRKSKMAASAIMKI